MSMHVEFALEICLKNKPFGAPSKYTRIANSAPSPLAPEFGTQLANPEEATSSTATPNIYKPEEA